MAWSAVSAAYPVRGIIFAYDEAQNLADQAAKEQYPLSLLLDCFQSLQRKGLPLMLVLTGLPTLFPKLVDARTFSERMFRVVFLNRLNAAESEAAIRRPVEDAACPVRLGDRPVRDIVDMSGGYPYFIQFICREVYDAFIGRVDSGEQTPVPVEEIERKLDADFFAGRWSRATDRQRALLVVISRLPNCDDEFTVQEVVEESRRGPDKPFSASHVNQMLAALASQGLVFKNRHGRYCFPSRSWDATSSGRSRTSRSRPWPGFAMAPEDFDALLRAARWTALSPYLDPSAQRRTRSRGADGAGASPFHGGVRTETAACG